MALDLPKHKELFKQRDVRETPVPSTTPTYITIADESATLANSRTLAVNTTDLVLTDAGAASTATIALKNKTSYWTTGAGNFITSGDNAEVYDYTDSTASTTGGDVWFCPVFLPHNAVITSVICYGADANDTWQLRRKDVSTSDVGGIIANATLGTADTTISNATIDNSTYTYWLVIGDVGANDEIYGAKITYTTDYD